MKNIKYKLILTLLIGFCLSNCHNTKKIDTHGTINEEESCIDKSKIDLNKPCTKEYVPVCGCNMKTYPNKCFAERSGVKSWTPGECNTKLKN